MTSSACACSSPICADSSLRSRTACATCWSPSPRPTTFNRRNVNRSVDESLDEISHIVELAGDTRLHGRRRRLGELRMSVRGTGRARACRRALRRPRAPRRRRRSASPTRSASQRLPTSPRCVRSLPAAVPIDRLVAARARHARTRRRERRSPRSRRAFAVSTDRSVASVDVRSRREPPATCAARTRCRRCTRSVPPRASTSAAMCAVAETLASDLAPRPPGKLYRAGIWSGAPQEVAVETSVG